ncbi:MAG TPA: hypothetical protein VKD69_09465 [Vicinamibacterales bacterium]|nr:hypothetical protein [Vicinamibacterales bacterium]
MRVSVATVALALVAASASADPLTCALTGYKATPGLTAAVADNALTVTWNGEKDSELRMKLAIDGGAPTVREIAIRKAAGRWATLAANVTPEFRVVSGMRRMTQQQLRPDSIEALGGKPSAKVWELFKKDDPSWVDEAIKEGQIKESDVERWKWEAFWDAPLYVEGSGKRPPSHATSIPPMNGLFQQKRLPRTSDEITRAAATYASTSCEVKTNGARLEITFPGVTLGVFAGRLQFDVFKGSNLIRQVVIAKTDRDNVAYKYDAGLKGLAIQAGTRVTWRDLAGRWQDQRFGGLVNREPATVWSSNRLIAADFAGGSIAAFPPPHAFYGARESNQILGDNYYRKDSETSFAFGIRQAEKEEDPEFLHNFALTSARPGTWQQMPVFLYVSADRAQAAIDAALAFTHGDTFVPVPGYQVMGSHYHVGMVKRLKALGGLDDRLNDVESAKAIGINIFGVIDGGRGRSPEAFLAGQAEYYDAARRQSDKTFLVMPNMENTGIEIGGHHDLMVSKPVFWTIGRAAGQPLVEQHPKYGTVYHLGGPADLFEMTRRENLIVNMPHPRAKGSTGFPDGVKETHFAQATYEGAGYRWGMGIDGSEKRLCEYRCLGLFDEMTNWYVDRPIPLKHMQAISEARSDIGERGRPPYDAMYANGPVNYVKLDRLPTVDDMSPIINAMKRGDYFVSSGEVLISSYAVGGSGNQRTISADVEWTFPLDFVEVVWGDGVTTDRQIIPTTDLPAFGKKHFQIPFNAAGKKWVRFAAWDVATNGAFVQPIRLTTTTTTTAGR